jgi:uncharacterized SAM-binding protein YcdF (DUF218 family)
LFAFSKIIWWFLDPANVLLAVLVLGVVLTWTGRRRLGQWLVGLTTLAFLAVAVLPIGTWLLAPLENRFPAVREIDEPVAGIILLGGAVNQFMTVDRGQPSLNGATERITEFIALARRYPHAKTIYTGGSGALTNQDLKEALVVKMVMDQIGFDYSQMIFESESRNTYENAIRTFERIRPAPGEKWILVTSANHMPRSVGVFRAAGWEVIPYPVDYMTKSKERPGLGFSLSTGLSGFSFATKEWIGLLAYRALGRTEALFPGPEGKRR